MKLSLATWKNNAGVAGYTTVAIIPLSTVNVGTVFADASWIAGDGKIIKAS